MIYLRGENTFDAKPGDFMIERLMGFLELRIMVKQDVCGKEQAGWCFVCRFDEEKYKNEIIDSKPTPALIARFSRDGARESVGKFEMDGTVYLKKPWGIVEVPPVHSEYVSEKDGYEWHVKATGINTKVFGAASVARCERARLIAWLEEA